MKKAYNYIFAALLLSLLTTVSYGIDISSLEYPPLNPVQIPDIKEYVLDNGLRLYLLEDPSLPLISASVRIHGGSYLEPEDKIGMAYICGSLLRSGGTEKWSSEELDDLLEGTGGIVETSTDTIASSLDLVMLSSFSELALEVMSEVLKRPVFEKERFEEQQIGYRSYISRRNDQATSIGEREFYKLIYGTDSPYARHAEYATINAITIEDLKEFHQMVFRPENVQMAIYGDINKNEILKLVKKHFGSWEPSEKPLADFTEVKYEYVPKVRYVNLPDAQQSNIYIGHIGGRFYDEDHPHRIVMNNILGVGFGSRLFREVRSRAGLAYSVYGVFTANMSYPGIFYNYVSTKTDSTVRAAKMIVDEIRRIQTDPPSEEELSIGKDRYLNSFVFNFDSQSKIINRMVFYDFFGLDRDFLNQQMEMVKNTTAEDVQAAAVKYLHPDALRFLFIGNIEGFDEPLENLGFGEPKEIDITIPE